MNTTLEFRYTVSRGRDSYGYNICSLYVNGRKVSSCNGGGYDMKGTALGNWLAREYSARLLKLRLSKFPENSHWEPSETPRMFCPNLDCLLDPNDEENKGNYFPHGTDVCPKCGGPTKRAHNEGKRVKDGRGFYGLSFHDPDFNPGEAVIGKDCTDRTLTKDDTGSKGKTVEQAEADGNSFGLERYQAFYQASSKTPDKRHRVPLIDGACGNEQSGVEPDAEKYRCDSCGAHKVSGAEQLLLMHG